MNKGKIIVGVLVLVVMVGLAAFRFKTNTGEGRPLAQLVDEQNRPVDLADFRGKVLFINNWASWCPPCVAEMPSIQALKDKMEGTDVVFIMVSFDENTSKATEFVKRKGFNFDIYFPGKNYPYVTSSIPATFVVNKEGVVVASHEGMADYNNATIVKQLKELAE